MRESQNRLVILLQYSLNGQPYSLNQISLASTAASAVFYVDCSSESHNSFPLTNGVNYTVFDHIHKELSAPLYTTYVCRTTQFLSSYSLKWMNRFISKLLGQLFVKSAMRDFLYVWNHLIPSHLTTVQAMPHLVVFIKDYRHHNILHMHRSYFITFQVVPGLEEQVFLVIIRVDIHTIYWKRRGTLFGNTQLI